MTTAIAGIGTLLKVGDGASPEVFSTIASITNISGPKITAAQYDVTSMDSTNNYREFISGLKDGGEVSFSIFFNPSETTHKEGTGGLLKFLEDRTVKNWRIDFPVSPVARWSFAGVVTGFENEAPVDGPITATITIRVSGKPTLS